MLKQTHIDLCARVIEEKVGIFGNNEHLEKLIRDDEDLVRRLSDFYDEKDDGLDTWEREMLLDTIAHEFTGRHWPCNLEMFDIDPDAWFRILHSNAIQKGWSSHLLKNGKTL